MYSMTISSKQIPQPPHPPQHTHTQKCQNCSWCRSFTFVSSVISETPSCNVDTVSDAEDRKSVCVTVSNTWADYTSTSPNQFMTRSQCSVKVSLFTSSWWHLPHTHHSVIAHSLTHSLTVNDTSNSLIHSPTMTPPTHSLIVTPPTHSLTMRPPTHSVIYAVPFHSVTDTHLLFHSLRVISSYAHSNKGTNKQYLRNPD